ncbi:PPC domain-containing DNA-binding protein [Mesorhizobium sp. A556]
MQSKLIHDADGQQTYAIILSTGDEVTACLTAFAKEAGLQAASFKAIGAFKRATLAYFDWEAKAYLPIEVNEQVEVAGTGFGRSQRRARARQPEGCQTLTQGR